MYFVCRTFTGPNSRFTPLLLNITNREGFELSISPPQVLFKVNDKGQKTEPIEEVTFEVTNDHSGGVVENIGKRKGELIDMKNIGTNSSRITALIPSRTLMGYRTDFETDTRGTGIMTSAFHSYADYKGASGNKRKGVLISTDSGVCTSYQLSMVEARGMLFVSPQTEVYPGGFDTPLHACVWNFCLQ
jgi:GTP-binding protein